MKYLILKIKNFLSPTTVFILIMLVAHAIVLFASLFSEGNAALNLFYIKSGDAFMDFFNSVRDASQGAEAYSVRWIIYPPMAASIFLLFSNLFPNAYLQTPFSLRKIWPQYEEAYLAITIFLILAVLVLFFVCYRPQSFSRPVATLIAVFGIFNLPNLYAIERGNIILFSTAATLFFLFAYNSENKLMREASLLALSFAFSIKLYPIVFAWLLLLDKRYKDLLKCTLYCFITFFLPTVLFGGISHCLEWFFKNTFGFSIDNITASSSTDFHWFLWTQANSIKIPYYIFFFGAALCFFAVCFVRRKQTSTSFSLQNLIYICALILAFPPFQGLYVAGLLYAPLLIILHENKWTLRNSVYFVLIVIIFIPIPFRFSFFYSFTEALFPTACFALLLVCMIDSIICIKNYILSKKQRETSKADPQSN